VARAVSGDVSIYNLARPTTEKVLHFISSRRKKIQFFFSLSFSQGENNSNLLTFQIKDITLAVKNHRTKP